jgi:hypothetical protein
VRRVDDLTTYICRLFWSLGAATSWNFQGLSRPVMGLLYFYLSTVYVYLMLNCIFRQPISCIFPWRLIKELSPWWSDGGARFSARAQTDPGAYPLSHIMRTGPFLGVGRPGRGVDHPSPSSAEVIVELYVPSPSVPSFLVIGCSLPLRFTRKNQIILEFVGVLKIKSSSVRFLPLVCIIKPH